MCSGLCSACPEEYKPSPIGLSAKPGIHLSRPSAILDELERRELVQRKPNAEDRRQYALHLTDKGREVFTKIVQIARLHQDALCASLTGDEREKLAELLQKIVDEQALTPGVHPGLSPPAS